VIIEDDADIRHLLEAVLTQAGFNAIATSNGLDGVRAVRAYDPIVTTLDVSMPGMDGFETAKRIREFSSTYLVMLTARDEEIDTLQGLEAGADDYLTKPFHTEELLARLRALLRRSAGHASPSLSCGGLRLDPRAARASVNGEPLRLTSLEYRLLHYMMMHQGRVIGRTELVEHLYDQDFDRDSNTIEVFIGRLRKKLGSDRIETVRGLGYRLTPLEGETTE